MKKVKTTEVPHRFSQNCNRRRGFVTLYLAMSLIVLLGISSLVVDLGIAYQKRSYMQKAADAAALAGAAYAVQNQTASTSDITTAAYNFATTNYGYSNNNATVTATIPTGNTAGNGSVVFSISRPQPTLFARIFRMSLFKGDTPMTIDATNIGATATAAYTSVSFASGTISGNNGYGLNSVATANLSVCGPLAATNRGDNYSSRYTTSDGTNTGATVSVRPDTPAQPGFRSAVLRPVDDRDPNGSHYQHATFVTGENFKTGDGYYFDLGLPTDAQGVPSTAPVCLQIFDPGLPDANKDSNGKFWNEATSGQNTTRAPDGSLRDVPTKTLYQVWNDNGTPGDISDDTRVFSGVYGTESTTTDVYGNQVSASLNWVNSCILDPSKFPKTSKFYMNVTAVDGTGKNGFNLRLNRIDPKTNKPGDTDASYAAAGGNGTSVTTRGLLPINFSSNGSADLSLGTIPAGATTMTVNRFDVDVGTLPGTKITYIDNNGVTFTGSTSLGGGGANDQFQPDPYTLPANYPGGTWRATYAAGQSDQSTWTMTYSGPSSTNIRLIG